MLKERFSFRTLLEVFVIVLCLTLAVFITSGIETHFENLATIDFWVSVGIRVAVTMVVFNATYNIDIQNRRADKRKLFYKVIATKQLKIKRIKDENRFEELKAAVKAENTEIYQQECDAYLHRKASPYIDYKDIPKGAEAIEEWLSKVVADHGIKGWREKRLRRAVWRIVRGDLNVKQLTDQDILNSVATDTFRKAPIVFSSGKELLRQNLLKFIPYFAGVIALSVFSMGEPDSNIWVVLVTNLLLILSATVSGSTQAGRAVAHQTIVLERQNNMLVSRMGIEDEYNEVN